MTSSSFKFENVPLSSNYSANNVKIVIVLSESLSKSKKTAFHCFLISLLIPELLRFKDLKNNFKKMVHRTARPWVKPIKMIKSVT